jgi:hypothetical protein
MRTPRSADLTQEQAAQRDYAHHPSCDCTRCRPPEPRKRQPVPLSKALETLIEQHGRDAVLVEAWEIMRRAKAELAIMPGPEIRRPG